MCLLKVSSSSIQQTVSSMLLWQAGINYLYKDSDIRTDQHIRVFLESCGYPNTGTLQ